MSSRPCQTRARPCSVRAPRWSEEIWVSWGRPSLISVVRREIIIAMLAWLRHRLAGRRAQARLSRHSAGAQGSPIQRSCIAISMAAIADEIVRHECKKFPQDQQKVFMMTYECFVMWALKCGFESVVGITDTEDAIVGMRNYFAQNAWYESGSFEKIWASIQQLMPSSLTAKGQLGAIYPVAEMITAANLAGFPLAVPTDYSFGAHVIQSIGRLTDAGHQIGTEHVALTQKRP